MLFDLRGRGRRRTVQAIYLSLAILMGGGLVLFGIGSDQSGGLFDAFSGENAGGSATEAIDERIDSLLARTRANPQDAQAWERHLALDPKQPSVRAANLMVQAYGANGLNELKKAVQAKQIVTNAEDPPSSNLYAQLAVLAYQAGETRTGDLAAVRAVDLAPAEDRKELRTTLDALKSQAAADAAQQATTTPSG